MVLDEVTLVTERVNGILASETSLLQLAVSSILVKKAGTNLDRQLKDLSLDIRVNDPEIPDQDQNGE